jgi:hypothetical protein
MAFREHGNVLRLYGSACQHAATLALIPQDQQPAFRKAQAIIDGKLWDACWTPLMDTSEIFVVYPDGDRARLGMSQFKFDPGV